MSNNKQEPTVNNIPLREYDELLYLQLNYNKNFDELNERFIEDKKRIEDECWEEIRKDRVDSSERIDKWKKKCAELEKKYNESDLKEKIKDLENSLIMKDEVIRQIEEGNEQLVNIVKERRDRVEELKNRTLIQRIFRKYE